MSNPEYHIPEWTPGDRFRKARLDAGLKQHELADLIGVDKNTIGNYENGVTTRYQKIVLNQWALATGVPVSWLRDGTVSDAGDGGDQPNGSFGWTHKLDGELAPVLIISPPLPKRPRKAARSNKAG
jgi:transcriptional regulator with XRE-family HTH domain